MIEQRKTNMSISEQIQNEILRPILKSQNSLLLLLFENYLRKKKVDWGRYAQEDKVKYIENTLRKDFQFRGVLLGTIVGHLTPAQYQLYQPLEEELNKRIMNMMSKRLCSQLEIVRVGVGDQA